MGSEALHPLILEHAVQRGRRHNAFKQQGRKNGRQEALQRLQNGGDELAKTACGGGAREAQHARVDVRVEERGDREDGGEDGDGRRDGQREGGCLDVDDAGRF